MANAFKNGPDDIFLVGRYADDNTPIFLRISHKGEYAWQRAREFASEFTGEECVKLFADAEKKAIRGLVSIRVV